MVIEADVSRETSAKCRQVILTANSVLAKTASAFGDALPWTRASM
jgi:hypothetical protein